MDSMDAVIFAGILLVGVGVNLQTTFMLQSRIKARDKLIDAMYELTNQMSTELNSIHALVHAQGKELRAQEKQIAELNGRCDFFEDDRLASLEKRVAKTDKFVQQYKERFIG